ncbi:MAG: HAD hydrolase family protein [Hyphomicrobiales bacterium]
MSLDYQSSMINSPHQKTKKVIVFTDLDGTLLNHDNYSYDSALPALHFLKTNEIPLILASSKTAAEIIKLRKELGFQHCEAIVENGAGILEPDDERQSDAPTHQKLKEILDALPKDLRAAFQGFSDWSVRDVIERTGLSENGAMLAKQRQFSEPGLWSGNNKQYLAFKNALEGKGVSIQQGGRFTTLSFGNDKSDQVRTIINRYETTGTKVYSIALGDAPNDIAMLKSADLGIVIPNPANAGVLDQANAEISNVLHADEPGSLGWGKSLLKVLSELNAEDIE